MVAANSSKVSRAPLYLGNPLRDQRAFAYGAITLSRQPFQTVPLTLDFVTLCWNCSSNLWLPRPPLRNACKLTRKRFGLFRVRSPLLPESLLFSLPVGTEMVHFPTFASLDLCIQLRDSLAFTKEGFPIRTFPDQCSRATPRDFSQLTTSFIAAISQGIHRQPLIT
jgi:hypothetical protein